MPREKEFESLASCPLEQGTLVPSTTDVGGWSILRHAGNDPAATASTVDDTGGGDDRLDCVCTAADTTLRLPPMFRKTPRTGPRWKPNLHFHCDLKVVGGDEGDAGSAAGGTAPAPEAQTTSLDNKETPSSGSAVAEAKEVVAGMAPSLADHASSAVPSSSTHRPASVLLTLEALAREGIAIALSPQPKYTSGQTYEIFFGDRGNTQSLMERRLQISKNDKIYTTMPGRHCTDKEWTAYWIVLHHGKVYAGIGHNPPQQCLGVLDDVAKQGQPSSSETAWYVGVGNSSMRREGEQPFLNLVRNIRLSAVPEAIKEALSQIDAKRLPIINVNEDEMDEETKALFKEYEQECQKARARAEKFGLPYKEPPSFLPWSKIRRLQANPKDGFATGMDLQDPAERAKQEARRKRFGIKTPETSAEASDDKAIPIPLVNAWDNEKMVRSQRIDPPKKLWKVVPPDAELNMDETQTYTMQPIEASLVPEKIHLFAIDWAAFKQIRTNDLSAYFSMYSPTYIEWLGDLNCNIHFQDKFSAFRALENLSLEIPSPPPEELQTQSESNQDIPDLGAMGWRLGKTMLRKVADDRYGRRGTTARVLLRLATTLDVLREKPSSKPKPPPGYSRNRVLGPGSEFSRDKKGKGKRSRGDRKTDDASTSQTNGDEPSLLSGSLKASRSGFTVEEMEAERARKRTKTSEGKSQSDENEETKEE